MNRILLFVAVLFLLVSCTTPSPPVTPPPAPDNPKQPGSPEDPVSPETPDPPTQPVIPVPTTPQIGSHPVEILWASLNVGVGDINVGDAVEIPVGSDIQAIIDGEAPGTRFLLMPGVHRTHDIGLRFEDEFYGAPGAVISGAVVLAPTFDGSYWTAAVTPQQTPTSYACEEGYLCNLPEQLFIADVPLKRVGSRSEVNAESWYLDYTNGRVYFQQDPAGATVEMSLYGRALVGATSSTVSNITFEKFATNGQSVTVRGAVDMRFSRNTMRYNSGIAHSVESRGTVERNRFLYSGQAAITSANIDTAVIKENEIAFGNAQGYSYNFIGAGAKFIGSENLVVTGNYVHDNFGAGLWTDGSNVNILYDGNWVKDNTYQGIFHEISGETTIKNNLVEGNGFHGIYISSSRNVQVFDNELRYNRSGLVARTNCRQVSSSNASRVENVQFYDNLVFQVGSTQSWVWGKAGSLSISVTCPDWDDEYIEAYFTTKNNRFYDNTYVLTDDAKFIWRNQESSFEQWQGYGQDLTGTAVDLSTPEE